MSQPPMRLAMIFGQPAIPAAIGRRFNLKSGFAPFAGWVAALSFIQQTKVKSYRRIMPYFYSSIGMPVCASAAMSAACLEPLEGKELTAPSYVLQSVVNDKVHQPEPTPHIARIYASHVHPAGIKIAEKMHPNTTRVNKVTRLPLPALTDCSPLEVNGGQLPPINTRRTAGAKRISILVTSESAF